MSDEEQNKLKEAVQTIRDFMDSCGGYYTSCLVTQDGTELYTDWGYVCEGLDLIEDYVKKREEGNLL